jgi:hypothetical protein
VISSKRAPLAGQPSLGETADADVLNDPRCVLPEQVEFPLLAAVRLRRIGVRVRRLLGWLEVGIRPWEVVWIRV